MHLAAVVMLIAPATGNPIEAQPVFDSPAAAYAAVVAADHWRPRWNAAKALGDFGPTALPYLVEGTRHENAEVQEDIYRILFERFPDAQETDAAVLRGLESDSPSIRYTCVFFAGTGKIAAAEPMLRAIVQDRDNPLRVTAAKSLAELGHAEVLPLLIESAKSDRYMPRHQANIGLKALTGRNLDDFAGYHYGEDAHVSGGRELTILNPDPAAEAATLAKRYQALAEFLRWLQTEKPELYATLVTEF